jgi:hypothetical protein
VMEWLPGEKQRKSRTKTCTSCTSFTVNRIWIQPGLNPMLHSQNPELSRLR